MLKPELVAPGHSVIQSLISVMVKREYHKYDRLIVKERGMCRRPTDKGIGCNATLIGRRKVIPEVL